MRSDADIKRLLLATAARGEGAAEAFEGLYKTCAPLLFGIAQRIVRRRELAEEVLHDGFTRIWAAAGRFDPLAEQPRAWIPFPRRMSSTACSTGRRRPRTRSTRGAPRAGCATAWASFARRNGRPWCSRMTAA